MVGRLRAKLGGGAADEGSGELGVILHGALKERGFRGGGSGVGEGGVVEMGPAGIGLGRVRYYFSSSAQGRPWMGGFDVGARAVGVCQLERSRRFLGLGAEMGSAVGRWVVVARWRVDVWRAMGYDTLYGSDPSLA
ncbi:hypothetical protein Tco_0309852 [Tanacetum coccineum]